MAMSVNTNIGAMVALQNLNKTNDLLATTQNRVSTGLRVSSVKDDAASYKIAAGMRSDVAAMNALKIGIGMGEATVGVAIDAGEQITDILKEMKAKTVQAQGGGMSSADRSALQAEFSALRDQLGSIVQAANFNGNNLIASAGSGSITVITDIDGSAAGQVALSSVAWTANGLGIDASSIATSADAATALTDLDTAIGTLTSQLSTFGSKANQLEAMNSFTSKMVDSIEKGIGALVDADMAKESSNLQSLQIKQQLGVQALGIANSNPQSILGLFG